MQAAKPTDPVRIAALLVGNAAISFESISNRANVILGPIWDWRISLAKYLQDPDMMIWFRQRKLWEKCKDFDQARQEENEGYHVIFL